jgi:hypothetical protein
MALQGSRHFQQLSVVVSEGPVAAVSSMIMIHSTKWRGGEGGLCAWQLLGRFGRQAEDRAERDTRELVGVAITLLQ